MYMFLEHINFIYAFIYESIIFLLLGKIVSADNEAVEGTFEAQYGYIFLIH